MVSFSLFFCICLVITYIFVCHYLLVNFYAGEVTIDSTYIAELLNLAFSFINGLKIFSVFCGGHGIISLLHIACWSSPRTFL